MVALVLDVADLLGDSTRVAAEHYVYGLTDYREVDRTIALARAAPNEWDVRARAVLVLSQDRFNW